MPASRRSAEGPSEGSLSLPKGVERGVPLSNHTSMRVGGPARFFARPESLDALTAVARWASTHATPLFILGAGTNILFHSDGYDGVVLCTRALHEMAFEGTTLRVGAGALLAECVWAAADRGLSGLEWAAGIPGTVGGAVVMNAGAFGSNISDVLESASLCSQDDGHVETVLADRLDMHYRSSAILEGRMQAIVLEAVFALRPSTPADCRAPTKHVLESRREMFPAGASAGCIFRNPPSGPTAGELLDRAGCKGMREGGAVVSERHANFIINEGHDNASDVLQLIEKMKARVSEAYGIELEAEVQVRFERSDAAALESRDVDATM